MHKFLVVTGSTDHVVDGAITEAGANALKATWFRNFPDVCFRVIPSPQ